MREEILLITADSELAQSAKSGLGGTCAVREFGDTRSALDRLAQSGAAVVVVDGDLPADEVAAVVDAMGDPGAVIVVVREHDLELLARGALNQVPRSADSRLLADAVVRILRAHARTAENFAPVRADHADAMIAAIRRVRHDMNNPLTSIMAEAQLMLTEADQLSAEQRRALEVIEAMAVRIRDLTQALHDITVVSDDG
ncbi:MAG: hypothetical protein JSU87_17585 [Gemmatimonadota bacterium]|nr:MAG: hypothetical protein JSU87_17585 [Gemmatimonadota bacterium]